MSKQTYFDRSLEGKINSMDYKALLDEIHIAQWYLEELFGLCFDRSHEGMILRMDDKTLIDEIRITHWHLEGLFDLYNKHFKYHQNLTNEYIERTTDHGKQGKN